MVQREPDSGQAANDTSCVASRRRHVTYCVAAFRGCHTGTCPSPQAKKALATAMGIGPVHLECPGRGDEQATLVPATEQRLFARTPGHSVLLSLGAGLLHMGSPYEPPVQRVCLCDCEACVCVHTGAVWEKLGVKGDSKVTLQGCALQVSFSQACSAASSSLAQTQRATWRPQLVENQAAGRPAGAGCPLPVSGTLGCVFWLLI